MLTYGWITENCRLSHFFTVFDYKSPDYRTYIILFNDISHNYSSTISSKINPAKYVAITCDGLS